jgi:hypothetical protein
MIDRDDGVGGGLDDGVCRRIVSILSHKRHRAT